MFQPKGERVCWPHSLCWGQRHLCVLCPGLSGSVISTVLLYERDYSALHAQVKVTRLLSGPWLESPLSNLEGSQPMLSVGLGLGLARVGHLGPIIHSPLAVTGGAYSFTQLVSRQQDYTQCQARTPEDNLACSFRKLMWKEPVCLSSICVFILHVPPLQFRLHSSSSQNPL